jgi:hypothetical protein
MQQSIRRDILDFTSKIIVGVILGVTALVITALINTAIGKVVLIGVASWIAVNIAGIDITDIKGLASMVKEDPTYIAEFAIERFF